MDVKAWKNQVQAARQHKDAFLASHVQSPLPLSDQRRFKGLAYWPPDPACRFELPLDEYADKDVISVADTGGHERSLWRWGAFHFELEGQQCTLHAYKSDPTDERFFIPFRDKTNGNQSYAAGRYLDLDAPTQRIEGGKWVLDLNEAYNPWCAYSKNYVCPFVPPENGLNVSVRAGEKQYPLGKDEDKTTDA